MGLSPWQSIATVQTAACDHSGTTTKVARTNACSACGNSWDVDAEPPTVTLTRQVAYPPPAS